MRGGSWAVVVAVLLQTVVVEPAGADEVAAPPEQEVRDTSTEWFSLAFGYAHRGIGLSMSLITLRGESFYWEIIQERFAMGVFSSDWPRTDLGYDVGVGSVVGRAWPLRPESELRAGLGAGFGRSGHDSEEGDDEFRGFAVTPQVSWVRHLKRHFAVDICFSLNIHVAGQVRGDPPRVVGALTLGMRI